MNELRTNAIIAGGQDADGEAAAAKEPWVYADCEPLDVIPCSVRQTLLLLLLPFLRVCARLTLL